MKKIIIICVLLINGLIGFTQPSQFWYFMLTKVAPANCGGTCVSTYSELQAALANSTVKDIYIQPGTYLIEDTLIVPRALNIYGAGQTTILKLDTSLRVGVCFYVSNTDNVTIGNLIIDGQSPNIDTTIISASSQITTNVGMGYQYGVRILGAAENIKIENIDFLNLDAVGLNYSGAGGGSSSFTFSLKVDNCSSLNCYHGFKLDSSGEYATLENIRSIRCVSGITIRSGNILVSNSAFTENIINAYIGSGSNNSHGGFSNCSFNHGLTRDSTTHKAIYGVGADIAESFVGCMFYDGDFVLIDCWGFNWTGGQVAGRIIIVNGAAHQVSNAVFYAGGVSPYGAGTISHTGSGSISLKNNFWTNGASAAGINN